MGFKEVASLDAEVTIAIGKTDKKTGKSYPNQAEGYYLGKRSVESKRGESTIHFLQTPKGNLGVWGTMDLNRKLAIVPPGTMVRIASTGTRPTPNGDMYTYKVEQDTTNTIEVSIEASAPSYSEDTEEESVAYTTDYGNGADEDALQSAALAAAERKAKVEALLNKGKSKTK